MNWNIVSPIDELANLEGAALTRIKRGRPEKSKLDGFREILAGSVDAVEVPRATDVPRNSLS